MYQAKIRETVNMISRNPNLWNEDMIKETLQRFQEGNSYAYTDRDFNPVYVQGLIKSYLHTLSDTIKREESVRPLKRRLSEEDGSRDFNNVLVSGI